MVTLRGKIEWSTRLDPLNMPVELFIFRSVSGFSHPSLYHERSHRSYLVILMGVVSLQWFNVPNAGERDNCSSSFG